VAIQLPARKRKVVGLDFTGNKLVGVIAQQSANITQPLQAFELDCIIENTASFKIPPYVVEQLQDIVKQHKLHGRQAVLSVPNHQTMVRYLDLPSVPKSALRQAVQIEIGTTIHLPFEDPVYDVVPVPSINSNYESLNGTGSCCLIVSPQSVITEMSELVKQAGLLPEAVELKSFAFLRAAEVTPKSREELTIVAHVREEEISLSIFIGAYLYFFRSMDMGISYTISDEKQIQSIIADIVYEMNRVVSFFNFNLASIDRQIGEMYLYSSHPCQSFICAELEQQLGTRVNSIEESEFLNTAGLQDGSEAMVALGLAMKRGQGT
jgi:Tfp pilus assembly PilM family ATPase